MTKFDQQWIQMRAYELWESEGRPAGKDLDHWYRATEEFLAISGAAERTMTKTRNIIRPESEDDILAPRPAKRRSRESKETN